MKKKILLSIIAVATIVGGVAAMSAYEAHVINVTAHIENALAVDTTPIEFGTVFPQEYLERQFTINLSSSFLAEERVDDVEYFIRQKPKSIWPIPEKCGLYGQDKTIDEARHYCYDVAGEDLDCCYLSLCPFLSKTDGDPEDNNDTSHLGYYVDPTPNEPNSGDEYCQTPGVNAAGRLAKSEQDISDTWIVDLKVPPVRGFVGQDWPAGCPAVEENAQEYGCDLWIEVTKISLPTNGICEEKADVMLVLDRSSSINTGELATLKTAAKGFVSALAPSTDGFHMGQTSFSTNGSLDLHLTDNTTAINAAIDGLVSAGYTNLYEGISLAKIELDNPGDGHDRADAESPDYMVIITDGSPNRPAGSDPTPEQLATNAATAAKNAGVTIYVVGVGTTPETADYLKNNIASSPAHFFDVSDWSQLEAILEGIAACGQPSEKEQACLNSGGTVATEMCCLATGDFPGQCFVGACSCALENSHEVKVCDCGAGKCFDGNACVSENH